MHICLGSSSAESQDKNFRPDSKEVANGFVSARLLFGQWSLTERLDTILTNSGLQVPLDFYASPMQRAQEIDIKAPDK